MNDPISPEKLLAYLSEAAGGAPIEERTTLFSSGVLDSFDLAGLLAFLEKTADKPIGATDVSLENFDTPERILRYTKLRS